MLSTGVFDTLWFWAVVGGLGWALVTFFAERQQAWPALVAIGLMLIGLEWWGPLSLLEPIGHHPLTVVAGAGLYLAGGALWSLARWWLLATAQRGQLSELLLDWLQARGVLDRATVPEDLLEAWRDHLREQGAVCLATPPSFSAHRRRILLWMLFWPFSVIWTAVQELVVETTRWLLLRLRRVYIGIAAWVYRDVPTWFAPASRPTAPNPRVGRLLPPNIPGWKSPTDRGDRSA